MPATSGYLLRNCIVCGKAFRTNRYHAKTCSDACRQKHYRDSKKSKQGRAVTTPENVTDVTLSYLDYLLNVTLTMPVAEDWQNS